ncbi:MAG: polysaccharide deacetylase family protein [Anaerolineae bacterium]|nr:polysaccharide deacetylase family protein [Anaerolineae bacterium]
MSATFILSLDTEIAWGTDAWDLPRFAACFDGYRPLVRRLLDLLERYEVAATWAVVGHLFLPPGDPRAHPRTPTAWYHAPEVIEWIRGARTLHEIGTHTFSHVYTRESSTTRDVWLAELRACAELHRQHGLPLRSLVFPRNQVAYLDTLPEVGIRAYRGEERSWYRGLPARPRRAAHLLDRALGLPPPTYALDMLRVNAQLVNLPASQFLMAYDGLRGRIPTASRVRQARLGLAQAVRRGHLYHLWFHPFNLGTSPAMFDALEAILREVAALRAAGQLRVMTMQSAAHELLGGAP